MVRRHAYRRGAGRFNRDWSRRVLGQGAITLLFTDGLERDGVETLGPEMERLHKSSRRLIWVNPLLRFDEFSAKAQGIRTMLPHVEEFRPIHIWPAWPISAEHCRTKGPKPTIRAAGCARRERRFLRRSTGRGDCTGHKERQNADDGRRLPRPRPNNGATRGARSPSRRWSRPGSALRPVGSHLAIDEEGHFLGSVSGGCVEGAVVEEAMRSDGGSAMGATENWKFGVSRRDQAWARRPGTRRTHRRSCVEPARAHEARNPLQALNRGAPGASAGATPATPGWRRGRHRSGPDRSGHGPL